MLYAHCTFHIRLRFCMGYIERCVHCAMWYSSNFLGNLLSLKYRVYALCNQTLSTSVNLVFCVNIFHSFPLRGFQFSKFSVVNTVIPTILLWCATIYALLNVWCHFPPFWIYRIIFTTVNNFDSCYYTSTSHVQKNILIFIYFLEKLAFDLYLKFVFSSEKSYKQTERILFPALTALPMSVIYGEYNNVMSRVHIFNKDERNSGRCPFCPLFRETSTH